MTNVDERETGRRGTYHSDGSSLHLKDDGLKTGGAETPHSKVVFTSEQQERVQALIDETYRKAFAKARKESLGGTGLEELKKEVEALQGEKKMAALLRGIVRYNVVDPGEVAELISRNVELNDEGMVVIKKDASNGHMALEEYVEHWLSERPHHLRASSAIGAGSSGAKFGGKAAYNLSEKDAIRDMPKEDFDKLLKEGINVQGSGGQIYKFKNVGNPFVEARKRKFAAEKK